jgi:hypothetical protein
VTRRIWIATIVLATLLNLGCGQETKLPDQSNSAKLDRLGNTLTKIQGDPNSSIELKKMASGVSQKLENDKVAVDFNK